MLNKRKCGSVMDGETHLSISRHSCRRARARAAATSSAVSCSSATSALSRLSDLPAACGSTSRHHHVWTSIPGHHLKF